MRDAFVAMLVSALPATLPACSRPQAAVDAESVVATVPSSPVEFPLRIGSTHRHLVDQQNRVVFLHGQASQSLLVQLDTIEAARYLEDRRRKGFNAIYVNLIERQFSDQSPAWLTRAGDPPFRTMLPDGSPDLTTPHEAYWRHVDRVLEIARDKGILVIAFPAYLGHFSDTTGWLHDLIANGADRVWRYGAWLGERYAGQPNLLWAIGGDREPTGGPVDLTPLTNALARGIRSRDSIHLMTAHSALNRSALDDFDQPWLDVNSTYAAYATGDAGPQTVPLVRADYGRRPAMPFVLLEGQYENEHGITAHGARAQAYWTMLGGAAGHFYGNWPTWSFGAAPAYGDDRTLTWQAALRLEGAQDMVHLGDLLRSRPYALLEPDDRACTPAGGTPGPTDPGYVACARASDGSTILAYLPRARAVEVDLTRLADTAAAAWWFDPRSGAAERLGVVPTAGTRTFLPPGDGDWVLVVDAAARGFSPPGHPPR